MKTNLALLLSFFFLITNLNFSQGEGALPSLEFQQSPLLIGAGDIGVAVPNKDAIGFYLNPAQLGYSSRENHLSFLLQTGDVNLLGNSDYKSNTFGFNIGYNIGYSKFGLPSSIGIGYLRNKIEYSGWGQDSYDCFSIGAGFGTSILVNIGFSVKAFNSKIYSPGSIRNEQFEAKGMAYDFGTMIFVPLSELFFDETKIFANENYFVKPVLNFTLGYAMANIGEEIYYVDASQRDPLLRTARLGYSINTGFDLNLFENKISVIDYSFTAEAEDVLIERGNTNEFTYQGLLGDIKFGSNLIDLDANKNVILHKGHILNIFETITFTDGSFGKDYYTNKTSGFAVSSSGLFKFLNTQIDEKILNYIFCHLVVEYCNSEREIGNSRKTNFKGIVINFKGLEL